MNWLTPGRPVSTGLGGIWTGEARGIEDVEGEAAGYPIDGGAYALVGREGVAYGCGGGGVMGVGLSPR